MKKPLILRLVGWLFVALVVLMILAQLFPPPGMNPFDVMKAQIVLFIFAVPVAVVWVIGSVIVWAMRRGAKEQANAMHTLLPPLTRPPLTIQRPTPTGSAGEVWDNPPTRIICDACRRPNAILHCATHRVFLCFKCCTSHDKAGCLYEAAGRVVDVAHVAAPAVSPQERSAR